MPGGSLRKRKGSWTSWRASWESSQRRYSQ